MDASWSKCPAERRNTVKKHVLNEILRLFPVSWQQRWMILLHKWRLKLVELCEHIHIVLLVPWVCVSAVIMDMSLWFLMEMVVGTISVAIMAYDQLCRSM